MADMAEYLSYDWKDRPSFQSSKERCLGVKKPPPSHQAVDRQHAVRALKHAVDSSLHLALRDKSKCQDERFLERFLFARKHDVQQAFQLLIDHYTYRQKHPELFENLNALDVGIAHALADVLPGVLAQRDRRGRCVLIMFASNWNPSLYTLTDVYRALLLTLETSLDDVQNQANGFVIVVDWTEFSFKQSSNMNPKVLKLIIEGLQDCFPARFKGIHFIAQPWYVETALTVIKPFLKGKTKERIHLHGYNLSTLHEHLTKDILPSDLGGEGPSHNTEEWLAKVVNGQRPKDDAKTSSPPYPVQKRPLTKDDSIEVSAKIDRGYKKSDVFGGFLNLNNNNNGGVKRELLDTADDDLM